LKADHHRAMSIGSCTTATLGCVAAAGAAAVGLTQSGGISTCGRW